MIEDSFISLNFSAHDRYRRDSPGLRDSVLSSYGFLSRYLARDRWKMSRQTRVTEISMIILRQRVKKRPPGGFISVRNDSRIFRMNDCDR